MMKALVTERGMLTRSINMLAGKSIGKGIKEVDVPRPKIAKNEILVKVRATALNPIDAKFIDFIAPSGNIAGCDFAGVVEEIRQDAPGGWKVNDRVAGFVQGSIDKGRGAFAEYINVEGDLAWKIPDEVSDEEAATFGIPAVTAMQALYLHLDIPWPAADGTAANSVGTPIFIYGGSSSVGLFAIQLAKKSGFTVITTASPHSFDLVKKYGADDVFDYHQPTAAQDIAVKYPNITRALDCFSEGKSTQFCAEVLKRSGSKVVTLLDSKANVPGVKVEMIMSFQLLGKAFAWLPPIGHKFSASPKEREALVMFYASLNELAKTINPPPIKTMTPGFQGILEVFDYGMTHVCRDNGSMVNTGISDVLPIHLRLPMKLIIAIRARSVDVAGWIALHAAAVAGPESHGQFLMDKEIVEPASYINSAEGQKVQKMLWNETVDEMSKLTTVPAWMRKV
ncbi:GroES-like protein [Bimuria novae-zelandiae CBS 107.79]|uniref:GroES-like protein n=1 Tax=Bimuria novae-zelandiae CBS 107.79 TaxID=1447943 RepID=A0A6A5V2A8_9PLEO|nr:GroES-like protein [Bimuria novae-zelandiae CBS 107.79]